MTDPKKDPNIPAEEELEESRQDAVSEDVPELELEDVSWEIDESASPAGEDVPPAPQAEIATDEPVDPPAAMDPFASDVAEDAAADQPAPVEVQEVPLEPEPVAEAAPAPEPEPEPDPEPEPTAYAPDADYTADWNWRVTSKGFNPFIFDFHSQKHLFSSRGVEWVDDIEALSTSFTYLVDYADSPGMGLLTLATEPKYAQVLARKNLEELGELSSEGVLQTFAQRKLEGGQVSLFYEVLPRDKHVGLGELYLSHKQGFVIADSVSLLHGLLKKMGRGIGAMAMHIPGSIILVAGKGNDVHLARRYTLIGEDAQALGEGIYALEQDLETLEKNLGAKIRQVDWVEGLTYTLNLPLPEVNIPIVPMPIHEFALNGEQVWSALPSAIKKASSAAVIGPKEEKYLQPLEQAEYWLWGVLAALAVIAFVGVYALQGAASQIDVNLAKAKRNIAIQRSNIDAIATDASVQNVGPALTLSQAVQQAALLPPFGELWNFLAQLRPEVVRVDGVELMYAADGVYVRLEGQVELELTSAQQAFTAYLRDLENAGFTIRDQQIDLGLDGNYYSFNALWPLKKKGE